MADKKKSLELFLFTDEPARELEHDHLGLEPFSSMVAAAALTNRGPFNIGVFSGWGQGKTSVLRQAEALIKEQEKPNVITAWVNAWQYEHEAHPIVPLLAIIINEITKSIDARRTAGGKVEDALSSTFNDLKRALRSIAYGFSAKAGAKIPGFANLEIGFVAKDMIDRDEKLSSDRDPLLDQSLYYHAYERLEKFREQLEKSEPKDQPKIIVFIDDLDRCLPSKALHLLESLKLVLAQPGFIFLLGVDRHVIDSFLTKRYHEDFGIAAGMGHGKQYMDKIIQLPLDLPHHQNRFEDYIGKLVNDPQRDATIPPAFRELFTEPATGPAFISALAAGCDRTPRTLVRTLNYLLTDLFLRENEFFKKEDDPFAGSAEFLQFSAVSRISRMTFGSEHLRLYRRFVSDDKACDDVANHFSKEQIVVAEMEQLKVEGLSPPPAIFQPPNQPRNVAPDSQKIGTVVLPTKEIPESYRTVIANSDSLDELFRTELGQRWLKEHTKRQAIEGFLATREDPAQVPEENSEQLINADIRENLGLREDQGIGDEDRKKITVLVLSGKQVSDLTALRGLSNLHVLELNGTQVGDLKALKSCTKLQRLCLANTLVTDLDPLKSLTSLQTLDLGGTQVSDLTALMNLSSLQNLHLSDTQVDDVTALSGLTNLQSLDLSNTQVSNLTPLKDLKQLAGLFLFNTQVKDLSPLYGLKECLRTLWLHGSPASEDPAQMEALAKALPETDTNF